MELRTRWTTTTRERSTSAQAIGAYAEVVRFRKHTGCWPERLLQSAFRTGSQRPGCAWSTMRRSPLRGASASVPPARRHWRRSTSGRPRQPLSLAPGTPASACGRHTEARMSQPRQKQICVVEGCGRPCLNKVNPECQTHERHMRVHGRVRPIRPYGRDNQPTESARSRDVTAHGLVSSGAAPTPTSTPATRRRHENI